ncbi:MAG: Endo,3,4-beta-glycanase ExsH [Bacteroidota bacterium]|jgi:beta-glucanase (GH16 family)
MRKLLILFLFAGQLNAQLEPRMFQLKTDEIVSWNYHFGDDFEGANVDEAKWHKRYPWGGLLADQKQYASPEMLSQQEGVLHMKVNANPGFYPVEDWMINHEEAKKHGLEIQGNSVKLDYITSCIWSKQSFRYGYFEIRAKVPSGQGLWPAFWLYGQNSKDEIDFMEMKGERPNEVHIDVHCPDSCEKVFTKPFGLPKNWGGWVKMNQQLTDEYVTYSGVWLPNSLTYYVNGVPVSHYAGDFDTPMNVIANMAVARDGFAFNPGPNTETKFPADYQVDYIRVWKLTSDNEYKASKFLGAKKTTPLKYAWNLGNEGENTSELEIKKKVRYVFNKKHAEKELGFLSLVPIQPAKDQAGTYQLLYNGVHPEDVKITVQDAFRNFFYPTPLNGGFILNFPKKGDYQMVIESGKNKTIFNFTI